MKAIQVPIGEWFMIVKTKEWYKKVDGDEKNVEATVIGKFQKFSIPNNTEVILRK